MLPIATTSLSASICNHSSYIVANGLNSYNEFLQTGAKLVNIGMVKIENVAIITLSARL